MEAAKIMAPHVELSPKVYSTALSGTRLFGEHMNKYSMNKQYDHKVVSLYKSTYDTSVFLKKIGAISHAPDPQHFIDPAFVNSAG